MSDTPENPSGTPPKKPAETSGETPAESSPENAANKPVETTPAAPPTAAPTASPTATTTASPASPTTAPPATPGSAPDGTPETAETEASLLDQTPQGQREPKPEPVPEQPAKSLKSPPPQTLPQIKSSAGLWGTLGIGLVVVLAAYSLMRPGADAPSDPAAPDQTASTSETETPADASAPDAASLPSDISAQRTYLVENGIKDGVVVTDSGLQYKVLSASGSQEHPTAADEVKVHYAGRLINGEEFDSSYARGEPIIFPLNGVIPGWTEGLQYMGIGDKFELTIPAYLAYGDKGAGGVIPGGATLVFDVELLEIIGRVVPAAEAAE